MPLYAVPQMPGYQQTYQPYQYQPSQIQPMQPQMPMTQPQNAGLQGRMVTSKEEALGVPVDFSGQPMLFPDLAHGVIYYKQFNSGTGSSDFREFRLSESQSNSPAYATQDDLDSVRFELKKISDEVASMKKGVTASE